MQKAAAIALFATSAGTARALGISKSAVSQWPDPLPRSIADRVVGAAVRLGKTVPAELLADSGQAGRQEAA
jgi:hypothetical protein